MLHSRTGSSQVHRQAPLPGLGNRDGTMGARNVTTTLPEHGCAQLTHVSPRVQQSVCFVESRACVTLHLQACLRSVALVLLTSPGQRDVLQGLGWVLSGPAAIPSAQSRTPETRGCLEENVTAPGEGSREWASALGGTRCFLKCLLTLGFFDFGDQLLYKNRN